MAAQPDHRCKGRMVPLKSDTRSQPPECRLHRGTAALRWLPPLALKSDWRSSPAEVQNVRSHTNIEVDLRQNIQTRLVGKSSCGYPQTSKDDVGALCCKKEAVGCKTLVLSRLNTERLPGPASETWPLAQRLKLTAIAWKNRRGFIHKDAASLSHPRYPLTQSPSTTIATSFLFLEYRIRSLDSWPQKITLL